MTVHCAVSTCATRSDYCRRVLATPSCRKLLRTPLYQLDSQQALVLDGHYKASLHGVLSESRAGFPRRSSLQGVNPVIDHPAAMCLTRFCDDNNRLFFFHGQRGKSGGAALVLKCSRRPAFKSQPRNDHIDCYGPLESSSKHITIDLTVIQLLLHEARVETSSL